MDKIKNHQEGYDSEGPRMDCGLRLLESGRVRISELGKEKEVRRGMSLRSLDGCAVGKVAAVAIIGAGRYAGFLLLTRLPESSGYQVVPADVVVGDDDGGLQLSLSMEAAEHLPDWHSA